MFFLVFDGTFIHEEQVFDVFVTAAKFLSKQMETKA